MLALTAAVSVTFAQRQGGAGDKILVTGEYALRQSDFNALTEFYEWLLNAEFTPDERRRFQTLMVRDAQTRKATAKAIPEIVAGFQKIRTLDADKREQARRQLLPDIVQAMEREENEINAMLLGIYRGAQKGDDTTASNAPDDASGDDEPDAPNTGAVRVSDLAGLWSTSSVSGERYKSLATGELSDPSGTIIEYQISPNGTIKHVGYLSMTTYSCTTKLFISRTGRISIDGSRITFDFAAGKRMFQGCGSAARNDTLPAERKTEGFRLERDKYGIQLCTFDEKGKDLCFRKKG
jgi:hypothetical protein